VKFFTLPNPTRRLAVRWCPGRDPTLPPVCIPNGLGATLITINSLFELLEKRGYAVLTYDRAGVGFSDPLPPSQAHHATAKDVVADMKLVLDGHIGVGGKRPWILVGPSMGSIVSQAYISEHPDDVIGFLNMDGFPYPFAAKTDKFIKAGGIYRAVASVIWTGIIRPFLALGSSALVKMSSETFPVEVIIAQTNQENFYGSLAREMVTMMDLASFSLAQWGMAFDIAAMDGQEKEVLINAAPWACGDEAEDGWVDLPRGPAEMGSDWTDKETVVKVVTNLLERASGGSNDGQPLCPLPRKWPKMVVRVMSGRDYNLGAGSDFYDQDMRRWAAAEHSLHAYLAKDGKRLVFPTRNHTQMFFGLVNVMAREVDEIATAVVAMDGVSAV